MGHPSHAADQVRLSSPCLPHSNSFPSKCALPGTPMSLCHTRLALPCHRSWPRGPRAVLAATGVVAGLVTGASRGQGWPAGGQAGCQHRWRNARISQEGDPGRMIYWDFIAVSVSSQLICTHKISSCWFSGDPCCQIRVPAPSLALDWLRGSTVHLGYPAREAGTQPHIGVSTCASQVRASPPWLGHPGKG